MNGDPFRLKKVCANCPFRKGDDFHLRTERRREIAEAIRHEGIFHCHKTIDYADGPEGTEARVTKRTQACAGALLTVEAGIASGTEREPDLLQVARRLGLYTPGQIDTSIPVHQNLTEWVEDDPEGKSC